jgi:hypothetical protein
MVEPDLTEREILATNLVTMPLLAGVSESEAVEHWHYDSREAGDKKARPTAEGLRIDWFTNLYGDPIGYVAATLLSSDFGGEYDAGTSVHVVARVNVTMSSNEERHQYHRAYIGYSETAEPGTKTGDYTQAALIELESGTQIIEASFTLGDVIGDAPLYLALGPYSTQSSNSSSWPAVFIIESIRASFGEPDDYGLFTGDTVDTDSAEYVWSGGQNTSRSYALALESEPEPEEPEPEEPEPEEPEPEGELMEQLAQRVAAHLGRRDDQAVIDQAIDHLPAIMAYIYSYTRGKGFSETGDPNTAIRHVIVSSCARLTANPEQIEYLRALDLTVRPSVFNGWTLPELAVLNQYRKRWA